MRSGTFRKPIASIAVIMLFALATPSLFAQPDDGTTDEDRFATSDTATTTKPDRRIKLTLTPGLTMRITPGFEPDSGINYRTGGPAALVRLSLAPEHLLKFGLESGFFSVTSINEKPEATDNPAEVTLTSIPVFFTASMGSKYFEAGGGLGVYSLIVNAGGKNDKAFKSYGWELGYMFNVSGFYPLSDRFEIGGDLRLYNFADRPITMLLFGVSLRATLLKL